MPPKKITIQDVFLIIAVVLLGVLLMRYTVGESGGNFTLSLDGEETSYSLGKDRELDVTSAGYHYTVTVKNGSVAVVEADCPDCVCVRTGEISRTGESIVCIPGHLIISVDGELSSDGTAG